MSCQLHSKSVFYSTERDKNFEDDESWHRGWGFLQKKASRFLKANLFHTRNQTDFQVKELFFLFLKFCDLFISDGQCKLNEAETWLISQSFVKVVNNTVVCEPHMSWSIRAHFFPVLLVFSHEQNHSSLIYWKKSCTISYENTYCSGSAVQYRFSFIYKKCHGSAIFSQNPI